MPYYEGEIEDVDKKLKIIALLEEAEKLLHEVKWPSGADRVAVVVDVLRVEIS